MLKIIKMLAWASALALGFSATPASAYTGCLPTTGPVSPTAFAGAINAALAGLIKNNAGVTAPATDCSGVAVAGQIWFDTSTTYKKFKVYDGTNWLGFGQIDTTNHLWLPNVGGGTGTVASATTADLCSVPHSFVTISGTTTITSFGAACDIGQTKFVSFSGILNLTYGASMLLPTGATIATRANDQAIAVYTGGGIWRVTQYQRGDGTALVAPVAGVTSITCAGTAITSTGTCAILPTPGVRLTLTSLTPFMGASVSGATSIYCTPYGNGQIIQSDGTNLQVVPFSEMSQALADTTKSPAAAAANSTYDVFYWNDAGTKRCTRGPVQTRTSGITGLTRLAGVYVNTSAITNGPAASRGVYVGTIHTNAAGTVDYIFGGASAGGTEGSFGVWNMFNRRPVSTMVQDTNAVGWTYGSTTWRQPGSSATMKVSFVIGLQEDAIAARFTHFADSVSTHVEASVGYDSITVPSGIFGYSRLDFLTFTGTYSRVGAPGFHYFSALEKGSTTAHFLPVDNTGLQVDLWN